MYSPFLTRTKLFLVNRFVVCFPFTIIPKQKKKEKEANAIVKTKHSSQKPDNVVWNISSTYVK